MKKNHGIAGGKLLPVNSDKTLFQELSPLNNFGAINYGIHLDIKLDYTLSRFFREMSRNFQEIQDPNLDQYNFYVK